MMTAANSAHPSPGSGPKARNVIAVASGKGGVGKTWFAITLAHGLARQGRRTLLFDGDLGLANVDIQLGLTPRRDLGGVFAGRLTLGQAAETFADGGFDIIAGRSGSGSFAQLPSNRLMQLGQDLADLARDYDDVILDLGAGVDRTVRLLAHWAGTALVITTPDPTALTDAYAFIKLAVQDDPTADIRVVVNLADSLADGQQTHGTLLKVCQKFLRYTPPLAGIIRRDRRVAEAIRAQTPLLTRHPGTDAAKDVEKLVAGLLLDR
ncbi:MAG: MinD/ParA family protein [Thalassobaculales bacterium]